MRLTVDGVRLQVDGAAVALEGPALRELKDVQVSCLQPGKERGERWDCQERRNHTWPNHGKGMRRPDSDVEESDQGLVWKTNSSRPYPTVLLPPDSYNRW